MTKIVIPDDLTIFHSEAKRLREERDKLKAQLKESAMRHLAAETQAEDNWMQVLELREENAKVREVNAEQAKRIDILTAQRDAARENEEKWRARVLDLEGRLMAAQQRMRRAGND